MLLALRIKNFRSIRDPQELNMRRTRPASAEILGPSLDLWDPLITPVAAIYGANASGKTSVIDALGFIVRAVRRSQNWEPGSKIERSPFLLDQHSRQEPSEFELEFVMDKARYQYGFALDDDRVLSEWLYVYKSAKPTVLFERGVNDDEYWTFGRALKGQNSLIAKLTRPNALFLSSAASNAHESLTVVYEWITRSLRIYHSSAYEGAHQTLTARMYEDRDFAEKLTEILKASDTGICGVSIEVNAMTKQDRQELMKSLVDNGMTEDQANGALDKWLRESQFVLSLEHQAGDQVQTLPFEAESTGTQALLSHAEAALDALADGGVCVFDEIDTSLHPLLVAELVRLFQAPETNPRQAQIVFTTHEASLLDPGGSTRGTLDRDQVWVTDKDASGSTTLTAFSEYKPRPNENLRRGYMSGRFGGLPLIKSDKGYASAVAR